MVETILRQYIISLKINFLNFKTIAISMLHELEAVFIFEIGEKLLMVRPRSIFDPYSSQVFLKIGPHTLIFSKIFSSLSHV